YNADTLSQILQRSSHLLGVQLEEAASLEIGKRSRGTPRIANNLLRWVRDVSQIQQRKIVDLALAKEALDLLAIDEKGLDEMDKKILSVMIDHHKGGPVGLTNLAAAVGEEPHTLEEVYEPFLILQGFIRRTPRGREATELAYEHIGRPLPQTDPEFL
ncbi:MAG: Holliday junction branch migration DNA helicase RuvB, partial [Chlamydiia bacterium]|nr:Holliday junction branch migration DNA helicase RuvB [Chlamydiia bacterium]